MDKAFLVVKLSRPRTWAFAVIGYLLGYLATGKPILWQTVLGIAVFSLGTAATNLTNVYTDIQEDSVNLPLRTEMVRQLGRKNLMYVLLTIYPLILVLSIPFGLSFILVVALAEFDSIGYSVPPLRFKRHPIAALVSFSGALSLPLMAGLVTAGQNPFNPLLLFLGSFMFSYGTVKNIPDVLGDIKAGIRTTATASVSLRKTVENSMLLLLTPYITLYSMVILNILSRFYLVNLIFLPFLLYWAVGNTRTSDIVRLEQLHTFGFVYAVSFILLNLVITYPSQASVGIAISTISFIVVVTRLGVDSRLQHSLSGYHESLRQEGENLGTHRN